MYAQCSKLSFCLVHSQGALLLKLCTRKFFHAPSHYTIGSNNKLLKKRAHTVCTPPKIVHPAVEMCAPAAGCTLNFEH